MAEAVQDTQVVLLLTEWPEFAGLRPDSLSSLVAQKNIIDGRNVLDPDVWREAGWAYRTLGVGDAPASAYVERTDSTGKSRQVRNRPSPRIALDQGAMTGSTALSARPARRPHEETSWN